MFKNTNKQDPIIYDDINKFLNENPDYISIHKQLPNDDSEVEALAWLFHRFSVAQLYYNSGEFINSNKYGWWNEKVSHWRYYQPERLNEKTLKEDAIV